MAVIVDTSALVTLADRSSPRFEAVSDFVARAPDTLIVPITVLPEADYLMSSRLGGHLARAMVRSIAAGELRLEGITIADLERTNSLMEQYADSAIGFVDASVIALAERLRLTRILTLDQKHFRFVRPRHCAAFDVLP